MRVFYFFISIALVLTVGIYTAEVFTAGASLLFLPLLLVLFFNGLFGVITVPLFLYCYFTGRVIKPLLMLVAGLALGFYAGLLIQKPIDDWDTKQRTASGLVIAVKLEKFKHEFGIYPDSLEQLDSNALNRLLPETYPLERFTYVAWKDKYDLDIAIPMFDRWHWDKEKGIFEYVDF